MYLEFIWIFLFRRLSAWSGNGATKLQRHRDGYIEGRRVKSKRNKSPIPILYDSRRERKYKSNYSLVLRSALLEDGGNLRVYDESDDV